MTGASAKGKISHSTLQGAVVSGVMNGPTAAIAISKFRLPLALTANPRYHPNIPSW